MPRPTRYIKYCSHDGCAYMASSTSREGAVHCMHSHVYAYHRPSMTVSYRGKSVAVERDRRTDELKCPCGQYVSRNARRLHTHATTAHGDNATSNTSITMASTQEDVAESNSRSSSPASSISSASDIPPAGAITSPISDDSPSARPSLPKNKKGKSNARSNLPATTSSATPSAFVLPKSAAEHMRGRPPASHTRKHLVSSSKPSTFSVNSKHPSHAKTSHENVVSNSSRLHLSKGSHALNGRSVVVDPSPSLEPSDSHPSSSNDNIPSASNHLDRSRALGRMADDRSSDPSSPEPPVNNPSRPKNKSFSRAVDPRSVIDLDSSPGPLVPPRPEKPLTSKATKSGSSSTLSNLRAFQESSKKLKTAPTTKSKAPAGPAATAWREVDIALPSQSERRHSAISQPRATTKTSSTARPKTTLKSADVHMPSTSGSATTSKTKHSQSTSSRLSTTARAPSPLEDPSSRDPSLEPLPLLESHKVPAGGICKTCRAPLPAPPAPTQRTYKSCEACRAKQRTKHKQWRERRKQHGPERLMEQFHARTSAEPASTLGKRKADADAVEGEPAKRARVWTVPQYQTADLFYDALAKAMRRAERKGRLLQFSGGYAVIKRPGVQLGSLRGPVEEKIQELGLPIDHCISSARHIGSVEPGCGHHCTEFIAKYQCGCGGQPTNSAKHSGHDSGRGMCGGVVKMTMKLELEKQHIGIFGQSIVVEVSHE